jgi:mannosyl-oligosaccharide glucosidase
MRDDEKGGITARVEQVDAGMNLDFFITLEGFDVKEELLDNIHLFDPSDYSVFNLAMDKSSSSYKIVTVERHDTSSPPTEWVSPATLLPFIQRSGSRTVYVPQRIRSMHFVFPRITEKSFVFGIGEAPFFDSVKFDLKIKEWKNRFRTDFSRKSISQLFGNLGRFHGPLKLSPALDMTREPVVDLTAIGPSRTKFPRGFLWDEGFHLLAVDRVNRDIAIEIITAWLRTQSVSGDHGWIPRELALSLRDRASIPEEFLAQDPRIANPPTLIFTLMALVKEGIDSPLAISRIVSHVARWLHHLEKTQASSFGEGGGKCFKWSMRTPEHCLSSGLDDYPRGKSVNKDECHVDLHSWMMLMVRFLQSACQRLNFEKFSCETDWSAKYREMHANLMDIFIVPGEHYFADYLGTSPRTSHSPHIGYVNLFPLLLGLLSPSENMNQIVATVNLIETHLISPFGLLSLSRSDPLFGTGENYWKGNIWANVNLLAIGALAGYARHVADQNLATRMKKISSDIRQGWLEHAKAAWNKAGGPREYLKPQDGEGGGVYPFAGWTAASIFWLEENIDFWETIVGFG